MRNSPVIVGLGLVLVFGLAGPWATRPCRAAEAGEGVRETIEARVDPEAGRIEWRYRGRTLLAYVFATNQYKPYLRELRTLTGEDVLRDAPADHLHHHGLMYAIRVNGVNFWEERDVAGRQRHAALLAHRAGRGAGGRPEASFTELIHWLPPGSGEGAVPAGESGAFLVERRTLALAVDDGRDEVALTWHADLAVGGRTNQVRLHGSDYNGLGLRVPASWDRAAHHVNSERAPYATGGKHDVIPARWGAVSGPPDGRGPQVVLAARPRGQAGRNVFFSMTEPFTYLSATQGLDQAPLDYRAGDRFTLDYLVLVHARPKTPEQIEARYQEWSRALP